MIEITEAQFHFWMVAITAGIVGLQIVQAAVMVAILWWIRR